MMTPTQLFNALLVAAGPDPEQQARIAWRMNEVLWRQVYDGGSMVENMAFARAFENLCKHQNWIAVKDWWPEGREVIKQQQNADPRPESS